MNIRDAIADPNIFAPWFERGEESWSTWFAFLSALFGIELSEIERQIYCSCTGRKAIPNRAFPEAWLVVGRRGGKSFVLALVAVFLACFREWKPYLAPGERGTVMIVAADRRQARVIFRYVRALLRGVPMLARLVERETSEVIELSNRIAIEVHTASFRTIRGYSIVAALCDELAFWRSEDSASPDFEVLNALRPGMATIPGAMLLCASSPYGRRGALYEAWRDFHGKDDDSVIVWQADTRTMNPSVREHIIRAAYDRDPTAAASEFGAEFRSDLEAYLSREAVEVCVAVDCREILPADQWEYLGFVDPSGGSGDAMTIAVAHMDNEIVVVDAIRERRPPFSPDDVVQEFAELLRNYRILSISGDRYGGVWPAERFRHQGIEYVPVHLAKSDLYRELLPVINANGVQLLDNSRLVGQLTQLERRTARGGRDIIDHPRGAHDDVANAVAGAVWLARQHASGPTIEDVAAMWAVNDEFYQPKPSW